MKHTHRGHCQLCDRLQAVHPITGMLAKHGYTKQWGFFQGTCPGSGHAPYEHSAELVAPAAAQQGIVIENLHDAAHNVDALAFTDPTYGRVTFKRRVGWGREEIQASGHFVEESREQRGDYTHIRVKFVANKPVRFSDGKIHQERSYEDLRNAGCYYSCYTPEEFGAVWRKREVEQLEVDKANHQRYRAWLLDRAIAWKLAELVAVEKVV